MISKQKALIKVILNALVKITIGGLFIGFFKTYDGVIALVLGLKVLHNIYKEVIRPSYNKNWGVLIGILLTGFSGILAEIWGVYNNYWEYHGVSSSLPLWLPFAWMLAFYNLYKIERDIVNLLNYHSLKQKLILTIIISAVLPTYGEIITIQLGVWTYNWPLQFLGVPLLAVFCLVFVHTLIMYCLSLICKKFSIDDPLLRLN